MKKLFTFLFVLLTTTFAVQAQWSEDFENGIPAGWETTGQWAHGDNTAHSSQYWAVPAGSLFMGINSDAAGQGTHVIGDVTTPDIDLTGYASPLLTMDAIFLDGDLYGGDETAIVSASTDGGTTWTEVLNLAGTGNQWTAVNALMADFAGMTIKLKFTYDDDMQWQWGFMFDNISISDFNIPYNVRLMSLDASCTSALVGKQSTISGSFINEGIETITSLDITWSDGTNDYTETVTGLDVESFQTGSFVHTTPVDIEDGTTSLDFEISNPNGNDDADDSDNGASFDIDGVTATEGRGIYVEEATGTWCTWCPRGAVWMDRMADCFGEHFVGVAVHNSDPMEVAEFDGGLTSHPDFTGFPSVLVDRDNIIDPSQLEAPTISTIQTDAVAYLGSSGTFNDATGELNLNADALFNEDVSQSGYRMNIILTEDGMSGTSGDWAQVNAYSGGGNGPMGGYEDLPSPVPADMMIYDHVGRSLLAGYDGAAGSLPDDMVAGETYSHTMDSYTVPNDMVMENVHVVVILIDNAGEVINSSITPFEDALNNTPTSVRPVVNNTLDVKVFPNPAQEMTNIRINLEASSKVAIQVFNSVGQMVASQNYGTQSGDLIYPFNTAKYSNGLYQLKIQIGDEIITKNLVISK